MTAGAAGSARRFDLRLALSFLLIAATAIYCVAYRDAYVALVALPFFALGCARGKRPAILAALSLLPAALLLAVSAGKTMATGIPLVAYDHFFLRGNVVMLAYNDWRVASGIVLTLAATFFFG